MKDNKIVSKFASSPSIKITPPALSNINDPDSKKRIDGFWNKDFKGYLDKLIKISDALDRGELDKEEAVASVTDISEAIFHAGDELEAFLNNKVIIKKIKKAFRELCGPWVYRSKIVKHAFDKPRGYPGDSKLIEIIYDNKPISENIGYCCDKYFLNNAYAIAVRNRKDRMRQLLADFINNFPTDEIKILNIACGSCREIKELYSDRNFSTNKRVDFALVDQDSEALDFCRNSLKNYAKVSFNFLQHNILEYIKDNNKYSKILGKQDMIYSIGLADYLPDRVLVSLFSFCYSLLKPKGQLIIAHKDISRYKPLPPDWACDWAFYPRNQNYLIKMITENSIKGFDLKVERELSGSILFLILTKV
ncbi:MAG: class I SAM-dependent methyltransferase [Candidatus Omnitrophica bacterium]|nr:class I SAM-dependent methyltransferase [Candidatus Omnitrophota bacterium]